MGAHPAYASDGYLQCPIAGEPALDRRAERGISQPARSPRYPHCEEANIEGPMGGLVQRGSNFSLQRTAGFRFRRFVGHWPAAAEFWRWAAK